MPRTYSYLVAALLTSAAFAADSNPPSAPTGQPTAPAATPPTTPAATTPQSEQDRKIEILSEEIEKLKAGHELFPKVKTTGKYGLGPAASKVYDVQQGISIGGYGEIMYDGFANTNQQGTNVSNQNVNTFDVARAVIYLGYKFNDKIVFNSEIEFEHVSNVDVEFAYFDYFYHSWLNFRAGKILLPMGLINQLHEPTVYLGAQRPMTEQLIIPTTWDENGIGIFGTIHDFAYKLFVVNGFDALGKANNNSANPNIDGYSAASGLGGGVQDGALAKAVNFAGIANVEYLGIPGITPGASLYYGKAGQNFASTVGTLITEAHIDIRRGGFRGRALFAYSHIDDVSALYQQQQAALVLTNPSQAIGSDLYGGYVELGYDILHLWQSEQELIFFGRLEKVDTQAAQPTGFQKTGVNNQNLYTVGVRYKPINQVAIKADYQVVQNAAQTGVNRFTLSLGYIF
ncbi:MAG: hypothetical protein JSR44_03540 [Spirochaetes bacterium]|nr:hypothetical protein [Spirochaetota bacterium]